MFLLNPEFWILVLWKLKKITFHDLLFSQIISRMLNFALCSRELPEYPCLTTATQEWTRKVTFLNLDCKKKKKKKSDEYYISYAYLPCGSNLKVWLLSKYLWNYFKTSKLIWHFNDLKLIRSTLPSVESGIEGSVQ